MGLRAISVCTGSGIGDLAFKAIGFARTVCYIEIASYSQRLIQQRIKDGWLDDAPLFDDLRTFDGRPWCGCVDLVFGGIPCQGFSVAGKRLGEKDPRNLWPDFLRVVREVGPRVVLLENVRGLLSAKKAKWVPVKPWGKDYPEVSEWWRPAQPSYFGTILGDLSEAGFDVEWTLLGADDVSAPHRRKRVWVVAYSDSRGLSG